MHQFTLEYVRKKSEGLQCLNIEGYEKILQAAMECNFEKAYEAFMKDPLVHGRISFGDGEKLLKE